MVEHDKDKWLAVMRRSSRLAQARVWGSRSPSRSISVPERNLSACRLLIRYPGQSHGSNSQASALKALHLPSITKGNDCRVLSLEP